jgi:hypothetical protein
MDMEQLGLYLQSSPASSIIKDSTSSRAHGISSDVPILSSTIDESCRVLVSGSRFLTCFAGTTSEPYSLFTMVLQPRSRWAFEREGTTAADMPLKFIVILNAGTRARLQEISDEEFKYDLEADKSVTTTFFVLA